MKRVKAMMATILVMAIFAGALAFKVKAPDVCAYEKVITDDPPFMTICDRTHPSTTYVTMHTILGFSTQYARTIPIESVFPPCPKSTTICTRSGTLVED